jgi:phosphatidylinositol alpha-1,6-mannosyltransferase
MKQKTKARKIRIVTRNLPPLVGGMERLNWHMADELSKFAEVKVVGPKGAAPLKPRLVPVHDQLRLVPVHNHHAWWPLNRYNLNP